MNMTGTAASKDNRSCALRAQRSLMSVEGNLGDGAKEAA